ncbi:hypothetical protein [Nocardia tengchongensis]|uniref:hypothetical protein n=1 Tax=Nocardia tengchongensis TaxID=2055889 RepID=UPI0036616052
MTRSRASAKKAGTAFETLIANYLDEHLDEAVERRARTGAQDRGDLAGLRTSFGGREVGECKDYGGQILAGPWIGETDIERRNDDAIAGTTFIKRRGTTDPGAQFVLMTVRDYIALKTGRRPEEA